MAESLFSRCSHFQYCLTLQAEEPAEWIFHNSELAESPVGLYRELASTLSTYAANVNAVFWGSLPQSRLCCGHVFCDASSGSTLPLGAWRQSGQKGLLLLLLYCWEGEEVDVCMLILPGTSDLPEQNGYGKGRCLANSLSHCVPEVHGIYWSTIKMHSCIEGNIPVLSWGLRYPHCQILHILIFSHHPTQFSSPMAEDLAEILKVLIVTTAGWLSIKGAMSFNCSERWDR